MKDYMIVAGGYDKGLKWDWTNPFSFSKEKNKQIMYYFNWGIVKYAVNTFSLLRKWYGAKNVLFSRLKDKNIMVRLFIVGL
jgi:hypothetical protein